MKEPAKEPNQSESMTLKSRLLRSHRCFSCSGLSFRLLGEPGREDSMDISMEDKDIVVACRLFSKEIGGDVIRRLTLRVGDATGEPADDAYAFDCSNAKPPCAFEYESLPSSWRSIDMLLGRTGKTEEVVLARVRGLSSRVCSKDDGMKLGVNNPPFSRIVV